MAQPSAFSLRRAQRAICKLACAASLLGVAMADAAAAGNTPAAKPPPGERSRAEIVEADVSSRSIAVTSGFSGKEIIVFGSIHNSRQISEDERYYDVVVVVQGAPNPLVLRRKSNVAGVWMNTTSVNFDRVPSFYAVSSTRPLEKIASRKIFDDQGIGFQYIPMTPRYVVNSEDMKDYRAAIIRLKKKEDIYVQDESGVAFIGRSLFRSSVMLPANIPVGLLQARVYLFHDGELLSTTPAELQLEREGLERWLHDLAHKNGFLYGLLAILTAIAAGMIASEITRNRLH